MGDFTEKSVVKTSVRSLATKIADYTTFNTLITEILSGNPWGCTAYTSGGVSKPAVEKSTEVYTRTIDYANIEAKSVGKITLRAKTHAGVETDYTEISGNSTITSAMGGSPSFDSSGDSFSVTLKCHDANGELYAVKFTRENVTISSYEADSIKSTIETWADGKTILA